MASALITLTTAGTGTGPFDLYSNIGGYASPFESGVDKSSLVSGYVSNLVPNGTTIIRVQSTSVQCTNYVDISVTGITTTTTSTTTTTTFPPNAGSITNNTANTITASTAIISVNGSAKAYVTLNIAPGATQAFSTTYTPVSGSGNNFTLDLYTYTGVTTSNTMKQSGGDSSTSTGNFVNMGGYLRATSTTTSSGTQYVISMTIA